MEQTKVLINTSQIKLLIAVAVIGGIFGVLWQVSREAGAVVLGELPYLLGIFSAGLGVGYFPTKVLGRKLTRGQRLVTAMAVGLGLMSLGVMGIGLIGFLRFRFVWLALVGGLGIVGLALGYREFLKEHDGEPVVFEMGRMWTVLPILLIPFLILVLLTATIPPGALWSAEGGEVLEYHLQVPREWFEAGRIHALEHNAYGNLTSSGHMLFLLAMALKGGAHEAVYLAQMISVGFAIAFVAAVWVFLRPTGIKEASFAAVAAGTSGWVVYLSPLAYPHMGMLLLGTVGMGLIWRMQEKSPSRPIRYAILIGLALGLSAGFNHTGLVLMAGPLSLAAAVFFVTCRKKLVRSLLATLVVWGVTIAAVSPYLVRNIFWTGNPVYPWGAQEHRANENESEFGGKLKILYRAGFRNIISEGIVAEYHRAGGDFDRAEAILSPSPDRDFPTFGLALLILPWLIFLTRYQRFSDWMLVLIFAGQTAAWLYLTDRQPQLLVVWLAVLPFLVARSAQVYGRGRFSIGLIIMAMILVGGAGLNWQDNFQRYQNHIHAESVQVYRPGRHDALIEGVVPGYEYLGIINSDPESLTMLVGNSQPFYFLGPILYWTDPDRNEFLSAIDDNIREARRYIETVRPDYILVDWGRIIRLTEAHGFDRSLNPRVFSYLNSPSRFRLVRVERWGPMLRYRDIPVPEMILYRVEYSQTPTPTVRDQGELESPQKSLRDQIDKIRSYYGDLP